MPFGAYFTLLSLMRIALIGSGDKLDQLKILVQKALAELAIDDAVTVYTTDDAAYKMELGITQNPALAIEEESIEFRDMIFQGDIPEYSEIQSMFLSILGDETDNEGLSGCGTCATSDSGGCGTCTSNCL